MGGSSTTRRNEPAYDLFDRWLAHREQEADIVAQPAPVEKPLPGDLGLGFETPGRADDQDAEVILTEEEFEEFAHPALGGAAGAPPSLGLEIAGVSAVQQPAPTRSPVTVDALAAVPAPLAHSAPEHRPRAAPPPGLVLFSPRRGARTIVAGVAALLAVATGLAGYLAWQTPTRTSIGVAAALAVAAFLAWRLRDATNGTTVTIENGVLRVVRGPSVHQFPLVGHHPRVDVLGEPGSRDWKVLIQRRGMPPFVITRGMVDPLELTETLRQFRPDA